LQDPWREQRQLDPSDAEPDHPGQPQGGPRRGLGDQGRPVSGCRGREGLRLRLMLSSRSCHDAPCSRSRGAGRVLVRVQNGDRGSRLMGVSVPTQAAPERGTQTRIGAAFAPAMSALRSLEVDTRLLGMLGALLLIWVGFNILSGGTFLSARNLWNLSVQSASIAIMATGKVLIIVSRNIDLSVGSMLGFLGYTMELIQAVWIPNDLGFGHEQPLTWIITLVLGIALGALIGGLQGFVV